jgi:hypothetical protein
LRLEIVYEVQLKVAGVSFKMVEHQGEVEFKSVLFRLRLLRSSHYNVIYSRDHNSCINKL